MLAVSVLAAAVVLGAVAVGMVLVRMLAELRRFEAQVARTRADLEPRYLGLREAGEQGRGGAGR